MGILNRRPNSGKACTLRGTTSRQFHTFRAGLRGTRANRYSSGRLHDQRYASFRASRNQFSLPVSICASWQNNPGVTTWRLNRNLRFPILQNQSATLTSTAIRVSSVTNTWRMEHLHAPRTAFDCAIRTVLSYDCKGSVLRYLLPRDPPAA